LAICGSSLDCDTLNLNQSPEEGILAATTTMVHVRVDENVKAQAAETLASMGLTVSDAIRVFLTRVVADKALPFEIKAPNAGSRAAMAEASEIIKTRRARFATSAALMNDLEEAGRK
jgi:DNA-damage-inducible protein J